MSRRGLGTSYRIAAGVLRPAIRLATSHEWSGAEHLPDEGPALVVPNHKSFWDAFFVAAATRRHVRYMGKRELFEGPWGRLLVRLGPDAPAFLFSEPHAGPMEMRGRIMADYLRVAPDGYQTAEGLKKWITRATDFVETLPKKAAAKKTAAKKKAKAAKRPRKK